MPLGSEQSAATAGYVLVDADVTALIPVGPDEQRDVGLRCTAVAAAIFCSSVAFGGGFVTSGMPSSCPITVAYWLTWSPGCGT